MVKFNFSISNKQNNFHTNTVEDLPNEIWKEFKGYFVSNMGRIKSIKSGKAKIVFNTPNPKTGYVMALIEGKTYPVYRIIAMLFVPNPNNLSQVNHINEIKTDDRASNLNWMTAKDNTTYSQGKKVYQFDKHTKKLIYIFDSTHDAESAIGATRGEVANCCSHRKGQQTIKGFIFRYEDDLNNLNEVSTHKKRIAKINNKTNEIIKIYDSIAEAGKDNNLNYQNISRCCNGRGTLCGGFKWKFYYGDT